LGQYAARLVRTPEDTVPLLSGHLSFIREMPVLIDNFSLNDIEYLFGVHVPALVALALLAVYKVDAAFEISHGIDRISVVYLISSRIQDEELVQHLEDIGRGLMDDCEYKFALQGKFFQEVDNVFRVTR